MRVAQFACIALGLTLLLQPVRAADEPTTIIERAIKAAGGEENLTKFKRARMKATGTMSMMGQDIGVTMDTTYVLPLKYRLEMQMAVGGLKIDALQGFDGDKGWTSVLGETKDLTEAELQSLKDVAHTSEIELLIPLLKNRAYTLSALPEIKVNDKPAVGVKVSAKGHKDTELYFDKTSSLPVRTVHFAPDIITKKEAKYETTYSDYKEFSGVKHPTKSLVTVDGNKFMDLTTTELTPLEKVDDKLFAKP